MTTGVDTYIGTIGWTYKDWLGVFYPHDMNPRDFLGHYASVFDSVEIDSTFYHIPRPEVVMAWHARTPSSFRFTAKVPGAITHRHTLADIDDLLTPFLSSMALLGERLGCLLVQLPPAFRHTEDTFARVASFLERLPTEDFRFAMEFRHPSWIAPQTFDLLRKHNVAWTLQDHPTLMPPVFELTADFAYIRWMGDNEDPRISHVSAIVVDRTQELISWADRLRHDILPRVHTLFGFFNNHFSGHSPASCNQMKRVLGLPVTMPDTGQRQMSLF
ncbi:MAG: DUF72 domain-containing protein [candidate division Zixibacteria bacterium]|nr:DUF72 domain-containing protein [candidate division Zixibacteria bacterium]